MNVITYIFNKKFLWVVLRILFGSIFIFSGISKLFNLDAFAQTLGSLKIFNQYFLDIFSLSVPILEILLGVLIVIKYKIILSLYTITLILIIFTSILFSKLVEGEKIICNCFGGISTDPIDYITIFRNLFLILISSLILAYYKLINTTSINTNNVDPKSIINNYSSIFKFLFIAFAFILLCTQVTILAMQNRGLKEDLSLLLAKNETLQPGDVIAPFEVTALDSTITYLDLTKHYPSIIFLFSTSCKPCRENFPNWIEITPFVKETNCNVFGISIDDLNFTKKFTDHFKPNFEIYSSTDINFKINFKAFTTPQTILIGENSNVIFAYPGILNSISISKIFNDISFSDNK